MEQFSQDALLQIEPKAIVVRVGEESNHTDFTVHEDIIRESSAFFDAALRHEWLGLPQRIVWLPECDNQAFKLYVQWLYTRRHHIETAEDGDNVSVFAYFVGGYVLGEFLGDHKYRDSLLDTMTEFLDDQPDKYKILLILVDKVYEGTTDKSPVRKFLVDVATWKFDFECWDLYNQDLSHIQNTWPQRFLVNVTNGLSMRYQSTERVKSPFEGDVDPCLYHCHGDKPCYRSEANSGASSPPKTS